MIASRIHSLSPPSYLLAADTTPPHTCCQLAKYLLFVATCNIEASGSSRPPTDATAVSLLVYLINAVHPVALVAVSFYGSPGSAMLENPASEGGEGRLSEMQKKYAINRHDLFRTLALAHNMLHHQYFEQLRQQGANADAPLCVRVKSVLEESAS